MALGAGALWADWQFWAGTAAALAAAGWLFRGVIARRVLGRGRGTATRVKLTIEQGARRGGEGRP